MRIRTIVTAGVLLAAGAVPLATTTAASAPASAASPYAKYCKNQSKQHAKGRPSAYGRCVSAMRRLDAGDVKSARSACKRLSRKAPRGGGATPYRKCVRAAARLRRDKAGGDTYADPFDPS